MSRKTLQIPSPFSIAIGLTAITFLLAFVFGAPSQSIGEKFTQTFSFWQKGFWELLAFTMQMALILLLGHTLALAPLFKRFIHAIVKKFNSGPQATLFVCLISVFVSFINWGFCLIIGAILARKVGEHFAKNQMKINYPLLGAAGYSGMMCWHGGFSGSAPLTVAADGHFLMQKIGVITIADTVLSPMNIVCMALLLVFIPLSFYFLASKLKPTNLDRLLINEEEKPETQKMANMDLDRSKWVATGLGSLMLIGLFITIWPSLKARQLTFINLNFINFLLFGLGLILHGNIHHFLTAVHQAITGTTGIIIQFPLYAGIMGLMKYGGLADAMATFFVSISSAGSFPFLTFLSAGLINIFVPSGGGQWAVQGPIICDAAQQLGVSVPKIIMALAYGDQLTNMLQPFWALPLLGITGLKAKDVLPYTLFLMLIGAIIFILGLMFF